jgi:hypothetical protein
MTEAEWRACTDPMPMLEFLQSRASERKFRLFVVAQCRRLGRWIAAQPSAADTADLERLLDVGERAADGLAGAAEWREAVALAYQVSGGGWSDFVGGAIGWADARDLGTLLHPEQWVVRTLATTGAFDPSAPNCVLDPRRGGVEQAWRGAAEFAVEVMVQLASVKAEDAGLPTRPAEQAASADQAAWVREVFGNPARPSPRLSPAVHSWNDGTVCRIAGIIYDERRLPEGTLDNAHLAVLADALLDAGCEDEEVLAHLRSDGPHVRGGWALDFILGKE